MRINASTLWIVICTFLPTAGLFYVVPRSLRPAVVAASPVPGSPRADIADKPALPAVTVVPSLSSGPDDSAEAAPALPRKTRSSVRAKSASSVTTSPFPPEKTDAPLVAAASAEPPSAPAEPSLKLQKVLGLSMEETAKQPLHLKAGMKIHVTVDERLTVSRAQDPQGGRFKGILNKAIRDGHHTIAEKDSLVEGRFAPAEGENGRIVLALNLVSIRTVDGSILPLETASLDRGNHKSKRGLWKGLAVAGIAATSMLAPITTFAAPVTATVAQGLMAPDSSQMIPGLPVMPVVLEGTKVEFKLKHDLFFGMQ